MLQVGDIWRVTGRGASAVRPQRMGAVVMSASPQLSEERCLGSVPQSPSKRVDGKLELIIARAARPVAPQSGPTDSGLRPAWRPPASRLGGSMSNNRFHVAAACLGLGRRRSACPQMAAAQQAQSDDPDPERDHRRSPARGLRPARHSRRQLLHLPVDQPQRHLRQQRLRDQRQRGLRCRCHPGAPGGRQFQLVAPCLELLRRSSGRRLGRVQRERLSGCVRRHHRSAGHHAGRISPRAPCGSTGCTRIATIRTTAAPPRSAPAIAAI